MGTRWQRIGTAALLVAAGGLGVMPASAQTGAREAAVAAREARARARAVRVEALELRRSVALGVEGLERSLARSSVAEARALRNAARSARAEALLTRETLRGLGPFEGVGPERIAAGPPEPWLQEDPGDSIYRAARSALNREENVRAAELFQELRRRHPRSGYVPDSFYFQAFALFRAGGSSRLEQALELLEEQGQEAPGAGTREDARSLALRIRSSLARSGDAESFGSVARQAVDPCEGEDQELRLMALSALMNMRAEQATPLLREVLQSRGACSVELRRQAVFLLSQKMTDETVDVLLDLAHRNPDPDPEVREAAVFWLHQVESPEAVAALESILSSSDDPDLQEKALFALSQREDERSVAVLRDYAERSDAPLELRENAIFWLGQRGGEGSAFLRDLYGRVDSPALKEKIVFAVAQSSDDDARSWLVARVRDPGEPLEVRKNALFWAGQSGVPVPDLLELYRASDEPEIREQVIFALSQREETEAVDALMDIARDTSDPEMREKAVFWLGQSEDPRVADFLLELIRR